MSDGVLLTRIQIYKLKIPNYPLPKIFKNNEKKYLWKLLFKLYYQNRSQNIQIGK